MTCLLGRLWCLLVVAWRLTEDVLACLGKKRLGHRCYGPEGYALAEGPHNLELGCVSGDSPSESSSQEPPGFTRQACHATGRDLSGEDIALETQPIEGRNLISVGKKANTGVMISYAEDFAIEEDQVIAVVSAKHKARKKKEGPMR